MKRATRARQRGFTLIEVVVAFAIFALSVGALYEAFAGSARRIAHADSRVRALLTAESLLSEQRAEPAPWARSRSGVSQGFAWRVDLEPYPDQPANVNGWRAYQVMIHVDADDSVSQGAQLTSVELARELR